MGADQNIGSRYEKLNDALSRAWVSKRIRLTGKYAEVAMDSYGVQTKMWKWSWTIMEYKLGVFLVRVET